MASLPKASGNGGKRPVNSRIREFTGYRFGGKRIRIDPEPSRERDASPGDPTNQTLAIRPDPDWLELGQALGFLPAWRGLAVLSRGELGHVTSSMRHRLSKDVIDLRQALAAHGHPFALVAVAATGFDPDLMAEVASAGGWAIEVPMASVDRPDADLVDEVSRQLPDPRSARPSVSITPREPRRKEPLDNLLYRGPGPGLSESEIEAWARRVSDPDAAAAELD